MEYRVEHKYIVTEREFAVLSERLQDIMMPDIHQDGDCYQVRSLYFDDYSDRCLEENEAGVDQRAKYRIRLYDPRSEVINLEIKEKFRGLTHKSSCRLTRDECVGLMDGSLSFGLDERKSLNRLQLQRRLTLMEPKVIIAYERKAFVYPIGNVRVTFDRNIMASRACEEFLDDCVSGMTPVLPTGMHVLEVKYDELLPDFIARQLELGNLQRVAFSKYYLGRMAVNGEFPIVG